jgi:hypothetical protein
MGERDRYGLARTAAETMVNLWELEGQRANPDLDGMMRRLKDLSAYSLTHAEIMEQREVVELLALGMFFGATSDPRYRGNQERLQSLSQETVDYQGRPEVVEAQIAERKKGKPAKDERGGPGPRQMPLL